MVQVKDLLRSQENRTLAQNGASILNDFGIFNPVEYLGDVYKIGALIREQIFCHKDGINTGSLDVILQPWAENMVRRIVLAGGLADIPAIAMFVARAAAVRLLG